MSYTLKKYVGVKFMIAKAERTRGWEIKGCDYKILRLYVAWDNII